MASSTLDIHLGRCKVEPIDVLTVVASGDRAKSLRVLRDRLAQELDEERAAVHRRECHCVCGATDGRTTVAIIKELRAVIAELDAMPAEEEDTRLDRIAAARADDLAARRTRRVADATGA